MTKAELHLQELQIAKHKITHPSIPDKYRYSFIPTYGRLKPEKRILKKCEDLSKLLPGMKMNIVVNTGKRVDNRKLVQNTVGLFAQVGSVEYHKSSVQNGTADMVGVIKGKFTAMELKRVYKNGKDRQSKKQKEYQKEVEDAFGEYIIFKDFEEFYEIVMEKLK